MEKRVDSVNTTPIVIAFVLLLVAFFALLNHQAYRFFYPFSTTSSGLSYKAKRIGNGRKAKEGEWVQLSIIIKESANKQKKEEKDKPSRKSSIFINSLDEPQPFILPFSDDLQNKAIKEMIGMVEEKQRVIFKFSPAYFFQPQKPEDLERILTHFELKENDELTADIEIDKIMSKEERIEIMEKKRAEQRAEQTEKDKQKIADYLKSNTIQALSTAYGLFYSIDQPSQGLLLPNIKWLKCII
ncbi:hypothetical protein [Cardinium endosymbiont of Culicoides punctatus]|uniref:hypothetical protein n=1 Tax=Cardinium endosymbiont of Culicoides punctatus TaxID=2304601 RepID=UPI00105895BA|nr:hypothetical protein [Cardinium endosymbiont of Culicoides punctatus]TDG95173.1 hypothetical protein CCPUN_05940 [Cardinium endosymbiont of Culicoides punctatus]